MNRASVCEVPWRFNKSPAGGWYLRTVGLMDLIQIGYAGKHWLKFLERSNQQLAKQGMRPIAISDRYNVQQQRRAYTAAAQGYILLTPKPKSIEITIMRTSQRVIQYHIQCKSSPDPALQTRITCVVHQATRHDSTSQAASIVHQADQQRRRSSEVK